MINQIQFNMFLNTEKNKLNSEFKKKNYKWNAAKISKALELDVRTVRKYIEKYELKNNRNNIVDTKIKEIEQHLLNYEDSETKLDIDEEHLYKIKLFFELDPLEQHEYDMYLKYKDKYISELDEMYSQITSFKKANIIKDLGTINKMMEDFDYSSETDRYALSFVLETILGNLKD